MSDASEAASPRAPAFVVGDRDRAGPRPGQSAVYAIVAIANRLTREQPLSSQTATLNPSLSDQSVFDSSTSCWGSPSPSPRCCWCASCCGIASGRI
ncbi:MAG: hypothetical protein R2717_04245 [Schumannella sp.]